MTEIVYVSGNRDAEQIFTVGPNDCAQFPSGAVSCDSLGGPYLLKIGYNSFVDARADSAFWCDTGCAIKPNAKEKIIWVVDQNGDSIMDEETYQKYMSLLDQ